MAVAMATAAETAVSETLIIAGKLPGEWTEVSGGVLAPRGFAAAGVRCGIKRKRRDICLLVCATGGNAVAAGVFTQNVVRAPSVDRNEVVLRASRSIRAVVTNAGNANAGNGARGDDDNETMATLAAQAVGCDPSQVLTASTGVIGFPMPMGLVAQGIADAGAALGTDAEAAAEAAEAIMTTDTFTKEYAVEFAYSGGIARIGGMAKGSGMIAPNMATMLGYITTDLAVAPELLDKALRQATHVSFNALTVDGDTSTNDSCFLLASGAAGNTPISDAESPDYAHFADALTRVCVHLAKEIARDGEGATKLVTVRVLGAKTDSDARKIARTISESPLVKTALFGNDPNWGRIIAAAGRAGVAFNPKNATADLAGTRIFAHGTPAPFDAPALSRAMSEKEVEIVVDIADGGDATATFFTCDYSYDYIRINAEYHT